MELSAEGKLKRAMELANKLGARYTLIIGDNEIAAGRLRAEEHGLGRAADVSRDEIAAQLARQGTDMPNMETSVPLDFLGDLRRTHTCGATARRRRRQDAPS